MDYFTDQNLTRAIFFIMYDIVSRERKLVLFAFNNRLVS